MCTNRMRAQKFTLVASHWPLCVCLCVLYAEARWRMIGVAEFAMTIFIPYVFMLQMARSDEQNAVHGMPSVRVYPFLLLSMLHFLRLIGRIEHINRNREPSTSENVQENTTAARRRLGEGQKMETYLHYLTIFTMIITSNKLLCLLGISHFCARQWRHRESR